MDANAAIEIGRETIIVAIKLGAPALLLALVVGLAISFLQALTQIQETTLVFVPKILAIFLAMLIALPFMADALYSNFLRLTAHITNG